MIYPKSSIYVIGTAKINCKDPICSMFEFFFIGIILDKNSDKILDVTCNMVRDVTSDFIKSILLDYNIVEDIDQIVEEVKDRFHGMAQKAVIAAIKDARNKYVMLKSS